MALENRLDVGVAVPTHSTQIRCFQPGTALSRVLQEAPYLPRCSDNKTAARVRPRQYAIRYPYMQINRKDRVSWLIFDLDHSNANVWDENELPAPNIIVRDRTTGKAHLFYAITPVCTSENARSKPIQYMRAVYEAMAARLDADPSYHSGPVAKTPGHPWWQTTELHNHTYELGQLADYVDLATSPPWSKGPDYEKVEHSRHCLLFEQLRFYAYSIVNRERTQGTFNSFYRLVEAYALNHNDFSRWGFSDKLPWSSLRATIRSVARWTWDYYRGTGRCHRGAMDLDPDLPLAKKQQLAAERTNRQRCKTTEGKVRAACRNLQATGQQLTFIAIAAIAKLSRQTVATYRYVLAEVLEEKAECVVTPLTKTIVVLEKSAAKPSSSASTNVDFPKANIVNYGVYQVSAGLLFGVLGDDG